MRFGNYLWTCVACGWVNGRFLTYYTRHCTECKTPRGKRRNVAYVGESTSQYGLLDRNRRRGCPGKRLYGQGRSDGRGQVMTHSDGTAWQ